MQRTPRTIKLVPLTSLDVESQLKVRSIRNEDNVRKWMYTDHQISVSEHLGWVNSLKSNDQQIVFVVLDDGVTPVGVVSVNAIDSLQNRADWAYYLSESVRGGLGSALEYFFVDFVFETMGLDKLNCEVIEGNDSVVKLHGKFLFKDEGFRASNIQKDGTRIGIHLFGLTREDWMGGRSEVFAKHSGAFSRFNVSIDWTPNEKSTDVLEDIQKARAKNNFNWMGVLKLALQKSPEAAGDLVKDIQKMDSEISQLTEKLILDDADG
ncbi:MAG: UDP-4-amino-4,6-dideoxy-N-acetyl-beta-L-altrosamine N-acetyltransferase [Endozoicomonas sp.]|uniref:UDP-4-amino-4, 6-dideoxy-N-acetyl-beta-L-altrosamine N-acetyltransferase n=1 Tax=Endozoicomonas sp. TaxID=1892382 RepID=UPI003D9B6957